jgi:CRISPR/Cas system-associated exonuclease Cas4 (RecB family)
VSTHRSGSILDEDWLLVPIRMVNALLYCPREAWYQFALGEDPLNMHMERGLRRHETFAAAHPEAEDPTAVVYRHLPVVAPRLGVQGVIDELSISADQAVIVEYKATRVPRAVWPGIVAQVMIQGLALREHAASDRWLGPPVPEQVRLRVYFSDARRYRDVPWTTRSEQTARDALAEARAVLSLPAPPPGNVGRRCHQCQHEPTCLPFDLPAWIVAATPGRRTPDRANDTDGDMP